MKKSYLEEVRSCYNLTAEEYSRKFFDELRHKPFDIYILNRFSRLVPKNSLVYDVGCGPGQIAKYLHDKRKFRVVGLDFAENFVAAAKKKFPQIKFVVDDMLNSKMKSSSADGIAAFYSIVHFSYRDVRSAVREWHRLLKSGGCCLFSFHVGEEIVRIKNFLEVNGADASWRLFDTDKVISIAERAGFKVDDVMIRYPYKGHEYESKRAYILMSKEQAA